jgi:anti-sigma factor RsiW
MNRPDHTLYSDLLNLEIDGCLTAEQQARLDEHLAGCEACRAERAELLALSGLLERSRLPVAGGFRERVMGALPPSGWESRYPRTWTFPVAVLCILAAAGVGLLGAGSARPPAAGRGGSFYGVLAALAGMLRASLVAGVGFTTASWRWFGMFVEQLLGSSMNLAMFGVFVVCLNLLLFSLIRRRRAMRRAVVAGKARKR